MNSIIIRSVIVLASLIAMPLSALAVDYDLVILNGRVMDPESKLDAVRNVGIKDGKIVVISKDKISGKQQIDASGHIVAPGFVDGHSHVVDQPLGQRLMLRDGVTTTLDLEVGALPVSRWYNRMKGKSQTNYGASVSVMGARGATFDPNYLKATSGGTSYDMFSGKVEIPPAVFNRVPTDKEIDNILELIDQGLKEGGLGIGPPTGYMVDGYTSQEMIGAQKLAGKYGRFSHVHTRFSSQVAPTSGILAFQEAIASAGSYGGGVIIAHFTAQALDQTQAAMDYVDALRADGVPVVLEVYPYNYGGAGNGIQADYLEPHNFQHNMGRTYSDIIDTATGKRLTKETYDSLVKSDPTHGVLFYNAKEEDVLKGVAHPDVLIGCDCFPMTGANGKFVDAWDTPFDQIKTHPRTAGAHGKVLRLTREKKVDLSLMQAISKMSYQYAKFLQDNGVAQMANKGRIKVGADADITIFDPKAVRDNSSLDKGKNAAPTTGIPYVVVNGTIVVKDSKVLKGVYPGNAIRASVQQ